MLLRDARGHVVELCRELSARGLVVGTAGNASVRDGDLIAVSPSGVRYRELQPEQVGVIALDGTPIEAPLRPTTELALHLVVHTRPDGVDGEVLLHTHAPASTALSVLVDEVPVLHYYAALFGGAVRVTRYARFGSAELADAVREALVGRTAALLGNHGAVLLAADPAAALDRAEYLEYLCEVALRALSTGLPPRLLDAAEIDRVGAALRDYGRPPVQRRL
jgi:L-fuculose-phosphate aldolase